MSISKTALLRFRRFQPHVGTKVVQYSSQPCRPLSARPSHPKTTPSGSHSISRPHVPLKRLLTRQPRRFLLRLRMRRTKPFEQQRLHLFHYLRLAGRHVVELGRIRREIEESLVAARPRIVCLISVGPRAL